jgi:hypothetical protein
MADQSATVQPRQAKSRLNSDQGTHWYGNWPRVRNVLIGVAVVLVIGLSLLSSKYPVVTPFLLGYLAFLIGAAIGTGELISRYRDEPFEAILKKPSFLYIAVNAVASALAFLLIKTFDWKFGLPVPQDSTAAQQTGLDTIRVLVAGFGAMALFRSALFLAKVGDRDVSVGPFVILQTVLNAADGQVDRQAAVTRAAEVKQIMEPVDADKAKGILPEFCFHLLHGSVTSDDFTAMKSKIDEFFKKEGNTFPIGGVEHSKAYVLGLLIMNYMGKDVLQAGVDALNAEIKRAPVGQNGAGGTNSEKLQTGEERATDTPAP